MNSTHRYFCRMPVLLTVALGCSWLAVTEAARGGPIPDGNLLDMLQYSSSIAIVEVVDCKPFDPLYPGFLWEPQQSATCRVREVLAGSPPKTFRVAIYSRDITAGDRALAFIGRRPKDTVLAKEEHEYLFYMSGGFHLLNSLVKLGHDRANAEALAAIKDAAKVVKPPSQTFPDNGLVPFRRLLESRDHDVRWWAFRVLTFAPTSPFIKRTLISCLDMDDDTVSSGAAYSIIYRRLELTVELERFLARRKREALPYAIPRLLKRMVVGPPDPRFSVDVRVRNYLLAMKIQRYLHSLPKADTERLWQGIAPLLTELQPWHSIGFTIDENGKPRALAQGIGPDLETLALLEDRLTSFLADVGVDRLSAFNVRFFAADDSPRIDVFPGR